MWVFIFRTDVRETISTVNWTSLKLKSAESWCLSRDKTRDWRLESLAIKIFLSFGGFNRSVSEKFNN